MTEKKIEMSFIITWFRRWYSQKIETYINERHEVLEEFKEPEFVNESKYIK